MRMRKILPACVLSCCLTGLMAPAAFADGCPDQEIAVETLKMKRAEDSEKAGKLKEAFNAAKTVAWECLGNDAGKRREALIKRVGRTLGDQEEKQGRLKEAFDWYLAAGLEADADRVMLKRANAKPDDTNAVGNAIDHFKRRNNEARVREMRGIAARNVDKWLTAEDKAFAARKDSREELGKARDWVYYAEAGSGKVTERAEKRGDTLATDDARRSIENAIAYYQFADKPQKAKGVRDKARKLGDEHARKGENKLAVEFYSLAGDDAKAAALEKKSEAEKQKTESARQDKFKKDQQSLEKELGL
ncbi:hypothetical protein SCL_2703 [Sulfuricaulis limicola]|uniref:Uncharacterized protein n=1 Tax=Sulfuricaulis limicola TaxID=1620215 RepID=A0A1B4XJK0_9GAMM|nr:hypothetical protein [Sulfuricaulis limicola]BAV34980.1 hypothetical protein SCL_2703 [Sulfuricaulis limicola]